MNGKTILAAALCAVVVCAPARPAAEQKPDTPAEASFSAAAAAVRDRLAQALEQLNALRARAAEEKIPLQRKLRALEDELATARRDYQQLSRRVDAGVLELTNQQRDVKARQEELNYLSNLLGEYIRNFESRLHIAELQRYRQALETARLAAENSNLTEQEVFEAQAALLRLSLQRLREAAGGTRFEGAAVTPSGLVADGSFALLGPIAVFRSHDGGTIGTVEQRLGSLEPTVTVFAEPHDAQAAAAVVLAGTGRLPIDPTLGNAQKIEQTRETFIEHVKKGGPVMIPIFGLAGAAFLVVLFKWLSLSLIRKPSQRRIRELLAAVAAGDETGALRKARSMRGPVGRMLTAGVEHIREPRELIEEVMYEYILATRLRVQRFLPFVAVSAASAPLLGLLGTVTGIINTFKLITVFGSGDVKTLSGGISEALITTEFGLIVAIPSLLLHAFLSRKARGVIDQMEKAAVALVNQVSKTPLAPARAEIGENGE